VTLPLPGGRLLEVDAASYDDTPAVTCDFRGCCQFSGVDPYTLGSMRGQGMTATNADRQREIDSTYEKLGLGTAAARAQFANWFAPQPPTVQLDIIITTTSNPNCP
jgi:hypothetical protein